MIREVGIRICLAGRGVLLPSWSSSRRAASRPMSYCGIRTVVSGWAPPFHEGHVVVADDGQAGGAGTAGLLGSGVAAEGHQVVAGQDRRGGRYLGEDGQGGVLRVGDGERRAVAQDQQIRVESEAAGRGAECLGPGLHDREVGRPGEVGDHPVAEPGQVGHGGLDAGPVIATDRRERRAGRLPVDQDDRVSRGCEPGDRRSVQGRGGHDVAVAAAALQGADPVTLPAGVVPGIRDERDVPCLGQRVLDPLHDRREDGVGQVRDDDADHRAAPGPQRPGGGVGDVPEAPGRRADPLRGGRRDPPFAARVERP